MHKFVISKREYQKFTVIGTSEASTIEEALSEHFSVSDLAESSVWDADVNVLEITPKSFNRYFFRKIPA